MKKCKGCKDYKQLREFSLTKETKNGYSNLCIDCEILNKNFKRNKALIYRYKLSLEDYNIFLENQKQCCAICKRHKSEFKSDLFVDHCHKTGKIRGLLCRNCNSGIGLFGDNIDSLIDAVIYLRQNT